MVLGESILGFKDFLHWVSAVVVDSYMEQLVFIYWALTMCQTLSYVFRAYDRYFDMISSIL